MEELERFLRERYDLSLGRKRFIRQAFKKASKFSADPFNLTREKFLDLLAWLEPQVAPGTWNSYVSAYRVYYRWKNGGEYPNVVKEVKLKRTRREDQVKHKLLSEREISRVIEAADHPRDKAMVGVCYEGGFRIGELLGMTIGDCKRMKYGYEVVVTGKTGTRPMQIVLMAPLLEQWLYCHPFKDDLQSDLWIKTRHRDKKGYKYDAANMILKRLAIQAGLKRSITWHMLRHTQATYYAKRNVNEDQMRGIFGWTKNSNMPSLYTHLSGRDYKDTVLNLRGVTKSESKPVEEGLAPQKCLKCGGMNPFDARHCFKCGTILSKEEAEDAVVEHRVLDLLKEHLKTDEGFEKLKKLLESL